MRNRRSRKSLKTKEYYVVSDMSHSEQFEIEAFVPELLRIRANFSSSIDYKNIFSNSSKIQVHAYAVTFKWGHVESLPLHEIELACLAYHLNDSATAMFCQEHFNSKQYLHSNSSLSPKRLTHLI